MTASAALRAGFLGLGSMGQPMAAHLADRQLLSTVCNRTTEKAERFVQQYPGVTLSRTVEDLALGVDAIFLCISTDADVLAVIDRLKAVIQPSQIVIDCSTVSPDTARNAAAQIRTRGAEFIDAPVTGGMEGARQGNLSVMAGGSVEAVTRCRPLFAAFSKQLIHLGPTGSGQAAKAVNQIMCAGINEAVTEALAFASQLGLDLPKTIDAIRGGAAGNWFLDKRGLSLTQGHFEPGFKLSLHQKDLAICQAVAKSLGLELPLTQMTQNHYQTLIDQGFGQEDISALYRLKRPTH